MTIYVKPVQSGDIPVGGTNGFTLGKRYKVSRLGGYKNCLANVLNDNGHERVVSLDGSRSAHLTSPCGRFCSGHFEVEREPKLVECNYCSEIELPAEGGECGACHMLQEF